MIPCPNCGLSNAASARFCANCGTPLGTAAPPPPYQTAAPPPYQTGAPASRLTGKNIALGCVVLLAIFLLFGLSCTRACFGYRRSHYVHRRYAWAPARLSASVTLRPASRMSEDPCRFTIAVCNSTRI